MINLFGHGFIGKHFSNLYDCVINEKENLVPNLDNVSDIFYTISTIDNYNVLTNPHLDIDTNLTVLIDVLENFRKDPKSNNVTFNFASSWFVYGDTICPANEDSHCNPKGFYSITKHAAEQLLISYCKTYNLNYRILRFANVLGIGDDKASKKKNAVTYLLTELKAHRPVDIYDDGNVIRDFIHVKDLCRAVKLVMDKGQKNDIYNIGNGIAVNLNDIIKYGQSFGSKSKVNYIEIPKFHKIVQVRDMYLDVSKLKKLGYVPEYSIKNIIDELYEIIK